jgi:hypothetical protein
MFEVQGVGGFGVPMGGAAKRPAVSVRVSTPAFAAADAVEISAGAAALAGDEGEVRRRKVEAARARLEKGAYRLRPTVLFVAERVSRYVG